MCENLSNSHRLGRPTSEMAELIQKRILFSAEKCFVANGFEATSMEQIAKEAHVSKRTLYEKYSNKIDLFEGTVRFVAEKAFHKIDSINVIGVDLRSKLKSIYYEVGSILIQTNFLAVYNILLYDRRNFNGIAKEVMNKCHRSASNIVQNVLMVEFLSSLVDPSKIELDSMLFVEMYIEASIIRRNRREDSLCGELEERSLNLFVSALTR